MQSEKILVALPEMARRLRVPAAWLRAEADADRIPHLRAGRQLLFNVAVVELVLAKRASGVQRQEVKNAS